jgi:hypothetical protein
VKCQKPNKASISSRQDVKKMKQIRASLELSHLSQKSRGGPILPIEVEKIPTTYFNLL